MFLQSRSTDVQPQINGRSAIAIATIAAKPKRQKTPPRCSRNVAAQSFRDEKCLRVDWKTERGAAGETALCPIRERMEARALHVAEQFFETDAAEIGGAAGDLHRQLN